MSKVENRYYPGSEVVYPYGADIVEIKQIKVSERGRKDLGDIQSLAASIADQGLISPILLNQNNELVAGERRLRSHELLGLQHVAVVYRETLTSSQLTELELEENQMRKAMQWHEEVRLIVKAHKLKSFEDSKGALSPREVAIIESTGAKVWGQEQTGRLMGVAAGQVSMALHAYDYIQSGDEEILDASSISAAYKILLKRREDETTKQRAQSVVDSLPTPKPLASQSGGLGGDIFSFTDTQTTTLSSDEEVRKPSNETAEIPLSSMFVHGNCLEHMATLDDATFHHIVSDPPYGIDMANLDTIENIKDVTATHQVVDNLDLLKEFITKARRIVKPTGFMLLWADASHFEKILTWGKDAGWKMQRWPLIWHKLHPCQNNAGAYNTTKDFEICVKFRNTDALLVNQGGSSVFSCDGNADAKMYNNPFAKPFELWQWLLKRIAIPGQLIYDPFGGEFSMARAAINCGMNPISVELEEKHFNKGLMDIKAYYETLFRGNVTFV
tara:strand:+ start:6107 stop:7606 length:1500 start_codon:yes stop_codon:yes gene_type:complete